MHTLACRSCCKQHELKLCVCIVACMCDVIGSNSVECNETGYCDCKGNAGGQRCNVCKSTFFNFSSSNLDMCEGEYISSL